MATKLVIVESPAKAKTIRTYLGPDYEVEASIGHIRDLLPNAKNLPPELKKKWWADYAVDIDNDFEPIYEVSERSAQQVAKLKRAMKGKEELILATDEDREGESISWHLLEVLQPPKKVSVKRIAFHEITRDAILDALRHPRQVDEKLVEAQETRRILDRLYGYTLSPVLWSRVTKNLSAGRVQSPAVKLVVERELARRNFRKGAYWGLTAELEAGKQGFTAELREVAGRRVATGNDFDDATGQVKGNPLLLDEASARELAAKSKAAEPWKVDKLTTEEAMERPAPPFMTTTLQQEANRKLGFSADRTMRVAQSLYEGVSLGGEQVGLITYMRTDSLSLSNTAIEDIRGLIASDYPDCLPEKPTRYTSKVRNAQEAHEAIRPTDAKRRPSQVAPFLTEDQRKVYELVWKRAVASQMKPARVLKTEALIGVEVEDGPLVFRAAGKQILFDGFRRLYTEDRDEDAVEKEEAERRLPKLAEGDVLNCEDVKAAGHETKPPARFTDASLIRELEKRGIGRPSTYASILKVIEDRGYVRKQGRTIVPTFMAFLTMEVLEGNFHELVDYGFTARMDEDLDDISNGELDSRAYLKRFFFGEEGQPGLKPLVEERKREIPYPAFKVGIHPDTGEEILVRTNQEGAPFLQLGPKENKRYGNVPEELAPADLTLEKAIELLEQKYTSESVGFDPVTGRQLLLKQRGGYYLEVERTPEEIERKDKPRWVSLPPNTDPRNLTQEELDALCQLPRTIGVDEGEEVTFQIGKYGPYIRKGTEIRNVEDWRVGIAMTLEQAVEVLRQPKYAAKRTVAGPIQDFGPQEGAAGPVKVLSGRFGPYVTDGETNATLPRGKDPASIGLEEALQILEAKRLAGPSKRPARKTARKPAKKTAAKKK